MKTAIEIKAGDKFYNVRGEKCHVINLFFDDNYQVIVYRRWNNHSKSWVLIADYVDLFLIAFDYGWKWID